MKRISHFVEVFSKSEALPGSLLLFGYLLLFKPALIYQGNSYFFFYGLLQSALFLFPVFIVCVFLTVLPSLGQPSRFKAIYSSVLTSLAIVAWVNGSFSSGSSGVLDGKSFEVIKDSSAMWQNGALLAALFAVSFVLATRFKQSVALFLFVLTFALSCVFAVGVADDPNPWRDAPSTEQASFSGDQNLLVILLDSFQSDFFLESLKTGDASPESFDGFTYFKNMAGTAPSTYFSVPVIHSGRMYRPEEEVKTYLQDTVVQASFLKTLLSEGYESLIINPIGNYCPAGAECEHGTRITVSNVRDQAQAAAMLFDISLFRAVPHAIKPLIFRKGDWLVSSMVAGDHNDGSNDVLEYFVKNLDVSSPKRTAKLLHLFSTHAPAKFDQDCRPTQDVAWTRESAIAQSQCAIKHVQRLLEALKNSSVYDQTAIVILADHGAGLPPPRGLQLAAMASPLLLIKPLGSRGKLDTSEVLASMVDIPATVCALLNTCAWPSGVDIFKLGPKTIRDRNFLMYSWRHEYWKASQIPIQHYLIRGPVDDARSWHRAGDDHLAKTSTLSFGEEDPPAAYGYGWSGVETSGEKNWRWAVGSEAVIHLKLLEGRDSRVVMTVATHAGNAGQQISITANGHLIGHFTVEATGESRISFDVPSAFAGRNDLQLLFGFSKWHSASSGDPRELAVMFDELAVVPASVDPQ